MEIIAKSALPVLGFFLSAAALTISFLSLFRKVLAEHRYIRFLRRNLVDAPEQRFDSTEINSETLKKAIGELEKATQHLSSEDREYILDSLHQESERGRARYADKLLSKVRDEAA